MGFFNKVKQSMSFDNKLSGASKRKPNMFDRAFASLEEKMTDGFDALEHQLDGYGEAVNALYSIVERVHDEYYDAMTPREIELYNKVQELTERIDGMILKSDEEHRRFLRQRRENLHNELADMLAGNEVLPEEVRAEIDQAMRNYDDAEPQVLKKMDRVMKFLPGQRRHAEIGNTYIEW